jgi:hypothetical protein
MNYELPADVRCLCEAFAPFASKKHRNAVKNGAKIFLYRYGILDTLPSGSIAPNPSRIRRQFIIHNS